MDAEDKSNDSSTATDYAAGNYDKNIIKKSTANLLNLYTANTGQKAKTASNFKYVTLSRGSNSSSNESQENNTITNTSRSTTPLLNTTQNNSFTSHSSGYNSLPQFKRASSSIAMFSINTLPMKNKKKQNSINSPEFMKKLDEHKVVNCHKCNVKIKNKKKYMRFIVSPCKHIFCGKCIEDWVKNSSSCPDNNCRSKIAVFVSDLVLKSSTSRLVVK